MARDLKTLIRLGEWQVDEKRRRLGEVLRVLEALEDQARQLEETLAREQTIARASPAQAGFLYANYAATVIVRREQLARAIKDAETGVAAAREELTEAYRDLKKYQVVQENREREAERERARQEQAVLDEIGLQGHRRKPGP